MLWLLSTYTIFNSFYAKKDRIKKKKKIKKVIDLVGLPSLLFMEKT